MTQKKFTGFPERAEVTPIPNLFFTAVIPQIEDIAELKSVLHIFWLLSRRRGYPRFVTFKELLSDCVLTSGLMGNGEKPVGETLQCALDLAVKNGIILHLRFDTGGEPEDAYFINTEAERRTVDKIQQGEIVLTDLIPQKRAMPEAVPIPNIFSLYEQNIGLLTPMIAEELREAEKLYPGAWIENAFREAVALNKRSWKYIARILERWATEGKDNGKPGRDFKKERDPDRYIKGKYGHMVER